MRVIRLMDEPDWQSRLSPIEEIFFATSPSAKTLRPDERQPFKERWLGRYRLGGLTGAINRSGAYKISEAGLLVCGEMGVSGGTWLLAISRTPPRGLSPELWRGAVGSIPIPS